MFKKMMIAVILLIVLMGGIWMYIDKNNSDEEETTENLNSEINSSDETNEDDSSILILYFSATNNTEIIAEYISEVTDGDLIRIIPVDEYTSEDLDYKTANSRANDEQNDVDARPEIANTNIDISSYDIIYLGYPIWWGDVPKIILTLLDTYDFSGKTVIPFCTSGSSGIEASVNTLRNYDDTINWMDGKRFSASSTKEDVEEWINLK